MKVFTDSDYAGNFDDMKSTSAVTWSSKKQSIVALSSTKAEYVAADACACQVIWVRGVLHELILKMEEKTVINCDNTSAIKLSRNLVFHGRCKHIGVRFHFLRDLVSDGVIELQNCGTKEQVADIFTKPLHREVFLKLRDQLGEHGVYYLEVNASVARIDTIRACSVGIETLFSGTKVLKGVVLSMLYSSKSDVKLLEDFKESMKAEFEMSDMGKMRCNVVVNPIIPRCKLRHEAGESVDETLFKQLVGSLMYITTTRLDIQFMGGEGNMRVFTDSDYACDFNDRKSTPGHVILWDGATITWSSKKQSIVALSSIEAEYVAAISCACQCKVHFLRDLVSDGVIELEHYGTKEQVADIFTKPLHRKVFVKLRDQLGFCSTWMDLDGGISDLGSFGEETDKITDLHQILEEVLLTEHGDDVAGIKRRRRDPSSDGVRDLVTASGPSNWLKQLPAGSITTWKDLTTRFLAQFFLPGRTVKLRNDILMFQQHHEEYLSEAWTRLKDLLQKVPQIPLASTLDLKWSPRHSVLLGITSKAFVDVRILVYQIKRMRDGPSKSSHTEAFTDRYSSALPKRHSTFQGGPSTSINAIKAHFNDAIIEPRHPKEPEPTLEDEFNDLHLNLPVLEVLAHAPIYNAILDKYVESLELGKNGSAFVQGETPAKMGDPGIFTLPWIVKDVEVHIGKLKLLNDFYVLDMKKDLETPLLVGRGFLATANAVIDCRMAKIAVGEGIIRLVFSVKGIDLGEEEAPYWTTLEKRESYKLRPSTDKIGAKPPYYARKDFLDCHLPGEWKISRDAELNPFKDTLVFRRMV
ncbi:MAK10-like protein [Tanacetum coccineum]|uniref:MAK10-like protein n=1 Tax=Tanacetum coccineum TaxID=301880 RepID=A0ABQ5A9S0_9ASTR